MIWQACAEADREDLIKLTREPMEGRVRLVWGFSTLTPPADCTGLQAYSVLTDGQVTGCGMAWDWPGGHRYLSGLRISKRMESRPTRAFWRNSYESLMEGVDHAWTSIGSSNQKARRILEKPVSWRPTYVPRQNITTWFIPLPRHRARTTENPVPELTSLDWRHVEIAGGSGGVYRIGRILHELGWPGIPRAGVPIRIAGYQPDPQCSGHEIRAAIDGINGFDGVVVVLPTDSAHAGIWTQAAPRLSWKWHSTLYSLQWDSGESLPPVPSWKGHWL